MKRLLLSLVTMMTISLAASAMPHHEAQRAAQHLTDRMVTHLRLSRHQAQMVMDANINYFLHAEHHNAYGPQWKHRNDVMKRVLSRNQYRAYKNTSFMYRPAVAPQPAHHHKPAPHHAKPQPAHHRHYTYRR